MPQEANIYQSSGQVEAGVGNDETASQASYAVFNFQYRNNQCIFVHKRRTFTLSVYSESLGRRCSASSVFGLQVLLNVAGFRFFKLFAALDLRWHPGDGRNEEAEDVPKESQLHIALGVDRCRRIHRHSISFFHKQAVCRAAPHLHIGRLPFPPHGFIPLALDFEILYPCGHAGVVKLKTSRICPRKSNFDAL